MKQVFFKTLLFILSTIIIVLLVLIYLKCNINNKSTLDLNLNETIEREEEDDLILTIYYADPSMLTYLPWDKQMLTKHYDEKFVIEGNALHEHIDSFKQIDNVPLQISAKQPSINCRLYYVLESKKNGILLDAVIMWAYAPDCVIVNGKYILANTEVLDVFYNAITPFLPERLKSHLKSHI